MRTAMIGQGVLLAAAFSAASALSAGDAPYAGQEARQIATLSGEDVEDLLAGRGWGFALPAELNGYPGPLHVLELGDALELSAEQRREVQQIFDEMNAQARVLGAEYVAAGAALSAAFDAGDIDDARLAALVAQSADVEAELRAVHLAAHLKTKLVMSRHQIMIYNRERGYTDGHAHGHGHGHD